MNENSFFSLEGETGDGDDGRHLPVRELALSASELPLS